MPSLAKAAAVFSVLVFLVFPILSPTVTAAEPDVLDVKTDPNGGIRATARLVFPAKPDVIQAMLTDYQHWPDLFEMRMKVADVKIRDGVATVDLRIEHALLPGERRLITESRSVAAGEIVTDLVGGDFRRYHRVWKLSAANGGSQTVAEFELTVAIDTIVPDWLVALATRRELEQHFRIVKEKAWERSKPER